jgi:hypothetical protein
VRGRQCGDDGSIQAMPNIEVRRIPRQGKSKRSARFLAAESAVECAMTSSLPAIQLLRRFGCVHASLTYG